MPVLSTHCLANHRGGVGKTTLTFQLSAAYAVAHPDHNVLVIDATDVGDVSEMLMGGLYEKRGREALLHLVPLTNTTRLFLRALAAYSTTHLKESMEHDVSDIVSNVLKYMPKGVKEANELTGHQAKRSTSLVNIKEFAIPLKHVNSRIPKNMYVCPSGLDMDESIAFSELQRQNIISVLRESFKSVDGEWKVFIDTDAGGENDVYSSIAVGISDFCLVPLHADMSDWYRVCPLLDENEALRNAGISNAKVQMILWNGLTVKLNSRCNAVSPAGSSAKCTFTPTKAEQDVISSLNDLVFEEAEKRPDLFLHHAGTKTSAEEFRMKSSICVRNFSVVGVASKDSGIPIVCICPGTFRGAHMTYNLSEATIERCRENLNELVKAIDEATEYLESCATQQQLESPVNRKRGVGDGGKAVDVPPARVPAKRAKTAKQRGKGRLGNGGEHATPSAARIYNTRNKYPLRDRARKNNTPLGLIEITEYSSTSTIHI